VGLVLPLWRLVSELVALEDMTAVVQAVVQLCHPVTREKVWAVASVAAALLHQVLLGQLKIRSLGKRLLWVEQVRGNRDISWRCSAHRNGYWHRFLGRN
jgi:hypothetical protein